MACVRWGAGRQLAPCEALRGRRQTGSLLEPGLAASWVAASFQGAVQLLAATSALACCHTLIRRWHATAADRRGKQSPQAPCDPRRHLLAAGAAAAIAAAAVATGRFLGVLLARQRNAGQVGRDARGHRRHLLSTRRSQHKAVRAGSARRSAFFRCSSSQRAAQ